MSAQREAAPGSHMDEQPVFLVHVDLLRGHLTAAGRLYRGTVHLLHDAITALERSAGQLWTIDVSGLTVGDHAGLRAIGNAYRRALRSDRQLTLLGASTALQHALARMRLDHHLLANADGPAGQTPRGRRLPEPHPPADAPGRHPQERK